MRPEFIAIIMALGLALTTPAFAQTPPETSNSETTKPAPKTETKPEKDTPKDAKDLDDFFKQGEAQAEDGPNCQPPPEPIA